MVSFEFEADDKYKPLVPLQSTQFSNSTSESPGEDVFIVKYEFDAVGVTCVFLHHSLLNSIFMLLAEPPCNMQFPLFWELSNRSPSNVK